MASANDKYPPGQHPNSQANLTYHSGRPKAFGADKKKRYLSVTDEGWEGASVAARAFGCSSVSEFLEKFGRGQVSELARTSINHLYYLPIVEFF